MSLFSQSLEKLFSNCFTKKEWAYYLCVKESLIDQWLNDEEIPTAHQLNFIVLTLERSSDVKKESLNSFYDLYYHRASEISPHGKRMLPTVFEFMKRPIFDEVSNKLATMSREEQETFLEKEYPVEEFNTETMQRIKRKTPSTDELLKMAKNCKKPDDVYDEERPW